MIGEFGIVKAPIVCDFLSEPGGPYQWTIGTIELDFRDDESGVLTFEHVDFPHQVSELDDVARLADDNALAPRQQLLGVGNRDRIFVFVPLDAGLDGFDSQRCSLSAVDADT
jgi:hypothetical protein